MERGKSIEKISTGTTLRTHGDAADADTNYAQLYKMAEECMKNAYAPYSGYKVGAAIMTADGRVFTGVNVENASYGCTVCAERTACAKAISEGYRDFEAIAVACNKGKTSMCGICRQFLSEFNPDIEVITGENPKKLRVKNLSELLPDVFSM